MNIPFVTIADLERLILTLDQHPVGAIFFLLIPLSVGAGKYLYGKATAGLKRAK